MSDITLEPAAQDFSKATSQEPFIFQLSPDEGRKIFEDVQKESMSFKDGICGELIKFPSFELKLVKPEATPTGKLPILYYIHGGGWVFGSPDSFGRLLGEIAKGANVAIFAIHYTRAPEGKFPTALGQIWEALEYITANGEKHNVYVSLKKRKVHRAVLLNILIHLLFLLKAIQAGWLLLVTQWEAT